MTTVTTSHIVLDDRGRAFIDSTGTSVAMIVMDKMNGLFPEQIHEAYPYLSLSQVYAALTYYYDHQAELDAEIAREGQQIAALRDQAIATGTQPTRAQLEERLSRREKRP